MQNKSLPYWKIKSSLFLNYFVFAILLNCVGTVILEVLSQHHITKSQAGNLDAYKDITIAVFSFAVAAFLPRLGYKVSMLLGLAVVSITCFLTPILDALWMIRLLLVSVGVGFALVKVCVYSTIGLITKDAQEHASFTSTLEGVFMVGVLSGYWIFGFFISASATTWLDAFWLLGALSSLAFLLLLFTPLEEKGTIIAKNSPGKDFVDMISLTKQLLIMVFIISIFAYVFIEQGISTWLPTFNNKVLHITPAMSVEMASILSAAYAIGRLAAGFVLRKLSWMWLLSLCLIGAALMILLLLPNMGNHSTHIITSWSNAPWQAFAFPLVGFLLAPLYPTLCSTILSAFPKNRHSAIMGLIMIFSALGGTVGSKLTGVTFGYVGGIDAIGLSLIPIGLLFILLFPYHKLRQSKMAESAPTEKSSFITSLINDEQTESLPPN